MTSDALSSILKDVPETVIGDNPYVAMAKAFAAAQQNVAAPRNNFESFLVPLVQQGALGVFQGLAANKEKENLFDYYKQNPLIQALASNAPEAATVGPVLDGAEYSQLLAAAPLAAYNQESAPPGWTQEQGKGDLFKALIGYQAQQEQAKAAQDLKDSYSKRIADKQIDAIFEGQPLGATAPGIGLPTEIINGLQSGAIPGAMRQQQDPLGLGGIPKEYRAEALKEVSLKANAEQQLQFAMQEYDRAKQIDSLSASIPYTGDRAKLNSVITNLRTSLQSALGREMNGPEQERLLAALPSALDSEAVLEEKRAGYLSLLKNGLSKSTPILNAYGVGQFKPSSTNEAMAQSSSVAPIAPDNRSTGTKIADTLSKGILSLNDALTFGAGDEIAAGGNAALDALLQGKDISQAYNERLSQARAIEQDTSLGTKLLTAVPAAIANPMGSAKTILGAIGQGAALGGAYGFNEGEGGAAERLSSAAGGAAFGGAASGVLGTVGKAIGAVIKQAPKMSDAANASIFGVTAADLKASAKNASILNRDTNEVVGTKLMQNIKALVKDGFLDDGVGAEVLVQKAATKVNELGKQITPIIKRADKLLEKSGKKADVSWVAVKEYLKKQTGQQREAAERFFKEEVESLKSQGLLDGKIANLQTIKQSLWTKAFGPDEKVKDQMLQMMGRDIRRTIEKNTMRAIKSPDSRQTIQQINEEMGRYLSVLPKLTAKVARESAMTLDQKIINAIKTTGGAGTGLLATAYTGNPLPAVAGLTTLLGTTESGRRLAAKGLDKLGGANADQIMGLLTRSAQPIVAARESSQSKKKAMNEPKDLTAALGAQPATTPQPAATPAAPAISEKLVRAMIRQESNNNAKAVSPKGARGLMQLMPDTAKEVAAELGIKNPDLEDPETNVRLGSHYMQKQLDKFGDVKLALAAYNAGPTRVAKWIELYGNDWDQIASAIKRVRPDHETLGYVKNILRYYEA